MSKQNFLDEYFSKRKENSENNTFTKKRRVEDENIMPQSNTVASQPDDLAINNTSTSDIQSTENNSIASRILTNNIHSTNNSFELILGSASTNNTTEKRSYKPWYSQKFPWLIYQPNVGGFCNICRNYWKPGTPLFRDMEQKTKGVFTSAPFNSWKKVPGDNGRLMKHSRSEYHIIAIENNKFRQKKVPSSIN